MQPFCHQQHTRNQGNNAGKHIAPSQVLREQLAAIDEGLGAVVVTETPAVNIQRKALAGFGTGDSATNVYPSSPTPAQCRYFFSSILAHVSSKYRYPLCQFTRGDVAASWHHGVYAHLIIGISPHTSNFDWLSFTQSTTAENACEIVALCYFIRKMHSPFTIAASSCSYSIAIHMGARWSTLTSRFVRGPTPEIGNVRPFA